MIASETGEEGAGPNFRRKVRMSDRTLVACIACKQKKQKCDGQVPSCRNCLRMKRDCFVEDPTTKRRQPRAYVQSLEERVAMLEKLLQAANAEAAKHNLNVGSNGTAHGFPEDSIWMNNSSPKSLGTGISPDDGDRMVQTPDNLEVSGPRTSIATTDSGHDNFNNDLSSEVGLLSIRAAGREPHYFGPSSSFSFSRILSSGLGRLRSHQSAATESDAERFSIRMTCPPEPLPSRSIGYMLSKTYFANIHPQYPFLHQPTFAKWEDDIMTAYEVGNLSQITPSISYFVFMVYAIASLIIPGNLESSAEGFYLSAQQYLEPVMQLDNLETIQAILCCATYSVRSAFGPSVWSLSGVALRQCVKLGYHRNLRKYHPRSDYLKDELAKRCFWVSYDLDRAAGITLGRPFGIADKDIDVDYPLDIDDALIGPCGVCGPPRTSPDAPSTTTSCAIHIYKMRQIWSRIHETLYSNLLSSAEESSNNVIIDFTATDIFRRELEAWYEATPEQLDAGVGGQRSVFSSKEWFSIAYNHSKLLLYRRHLMVAHKYNVPGIYPSDHSGIERDDIDVAFSACTTAAREICHLYRHLYVSRSVSYTWGSLHILFLAGLTYLHCLWASETVRRKVRRDDVCTTCTACTMVLVIMAERWNAVVSYRDIFDTLASKTITMMCDTDREASLVPGLPASRQPWLRQAVAEDTLTQPPYDEWINSMADIGMCGGVEMILNGFLGNDGSNIE